MPGPGVSENAQTNVIPAEWITEPAVGSGAGRRSRRTADGRTAPVTRGLASSIKTVSLFPHSATVEQRRHFSGPASQAVAGRKGERQGPVFPVARPFPPASLLNS